MTTDNRTNEQIVDEAMSVQWGSGGWLARAVVTALEDAGRLVAAQGAAPQAESDELAWYKRAAKHSADSMAEARATLQQLADRVDPFVFDELSSVLDDQPLDYETGDVIGEVAPVLLSSTVDEDALAEVTESIIRENWETFNNRREGSQAIARAVAKWLKEQGR